MFGADLDYIEWHVGKELNQPLVCLLYKYNITTVIIKFSH